MSEMRFRTLQQVCIRVRVSGGKEDTQKQRRAQRLLNHAFSLLLIALPTYLNALRSEKMTFVLLQW